MLLALGPEVINGVIEELLYDGKRNCVVVAVGAVPDDDEFEMPLDEAEIGPEVELIIEEDTDDDAEAEAGGGRA